MSNIVTVKLEALQRQSEIQHDAVMKTLDAFRVEMRSEFAALSANSQVGVLRQGSLTSELPRTYVISTGAVRLYRTAQRRDPCISPSSASLRDLLFGD